MIDRNDLVIAEIRRIWRGEGNVQRTAKKHLGSSLVFDAAEFSLKESLGVKLKGLVWSFEVIARELDCLEGVAIISSLFLPVGAPPFQRRAKTRQ